MNISYFHVADEVPADNEPESAVVIDVLRATTTIAIALSNGAEAIQTFADLDELRTASSNWRPENRLLVGERGGKKLKGFDFGNSPVALSKEVVQKKRLFMSTTNGTRSLDKVRSAKALFTLSLPNRKAVADKLLAMKLKEIVILGSGWEGSYSLEDSLAAGSLVSYLLSSSHSLVNLVNDEALASLALWEYWKGSIERCLRISSHGKRLSALGDHDDDFHCCSQLDNLEVIPTQTKPGVIQAA
mgnify:CR=1 FL=1